MSAFDEFAASLDDTDVMKHALRSLREEPAYLLRDMCRQCDRTGRPVPDHNLQPTGFGHETSLRALVSAGYARQLSGGTLAVYVYEPTAEGREQYANLKADGFYQRT